MLIDIHTHREEAGSGPLRVVSYHRNFQHASSVGFCSVGVHPCYLEAVESHLLQLEEIALSPNVLAIGECGLDTVCNRNEALQKDVFTRQVALAGKVSKPIIIHCVRAHDELLRIMLRLKPAVPAILHGYNKRPEIASRLLDAGMYLSFGAAIMNELSPAAKVLANIPADRFFLETDDADVRIGEIYECAARLRKTAPELLILQLQDNFSKVFKRNI